MTPAVALATLGRGAFAAFQGAGAAALFAIEALSHLLRPPFHGKLFVRQLIEIGFFSLPVVALTAIFSGMVLALQSYTGFARFNAEGAVATVVVLSITRELAPVLAGLMVAGRVGASMAAEIGTMRVTDQIDALTTLSTNPMKYLVVPRLLAATRPSPTCSRAWSRPRCSASSSRSWAASTATIPRAARRVWARPPPRRWSRPPS